MSGEAYRAALYMRLSKEDDRNEEDSSSIQTQRKMLQSFAKENGFLIYDEYVDDGWSGTNFNRPAFQRMIRDIELGNINMVITKDLSRLGRDYITAGQYTEMYFPEHDVRYIAVNDGYDSMHPYNDIAPFKHIINEMYARDTSKKIRSAIMTKMKEGSYIGNFAPYGYKKDPENKNHLIIDYEVSPIIQKIFQMAEEGERPSDIARFLNEQQILTPAVYRCKNRPYLDVNTYTKRKEWTSSMICKILKNIVYLGHTAQGKTRKLSFKSKITITNPEEDWYVVRNTHEPLISQTTFDIVKKRSISRKRSSNKGFINIFSGIAKCMDCGRNMSATGTRKKGVSANLVCGGYKLYGCRECSNHFIEYDVLYNTVLSQLQKQIKLSMDDKTKIIEKIKNYLKSTEKQKGVTNLIHSLQKRSKELDTIIQNLYEDTVTGKIDSNRFYKMLSYYEEEQKEIDNTIVIHTQRIESTQQEEASNFLFKEMQNISEMKELTSDILHSFIDHIEIGQGHYEINEQGEREKHQTIIIFYRFQNPV